MSAENDLVADFSVAGVRAGDRATTLTSMRPTGRVRHGPSGQAVDCRSERGWIDAGREVVFARREERWLVVRPADEHSNGNASSGQGELLATLDATGAVELKKPDVDKPASAGGGFEKSAWWAAAGAAIGLVLLLADGQSSGVPAAVGTIALTAAWAVPMGWLGRRVHRGAMPALRPALVWLFALLGFAVAAVICLPTLGAPQTAILSVAASAIGACVVTLAEIVVGAGHA